MKKILIFLAAAMFSIACTSNTGGRHTEDFNFDWKFVLGDNAEYSEPGFDDSGWRDLHLPHDWSIEGNFSPEHPSTPSGGALPGGIGWYRKHFKTPSADRVYVEFDGVFMNSTVYVNGQAVGTRPYGYSSFCYDITSCLNAPGKQNVIAVRCDNADQPNSRWYAGCGIYRNVRLVTTNAVHVKYNGTYVTTPSVSAEAASVHVETEIEAPEGAQYSTVYTILSPSGDQVAYSRTPDLTIETPHFWDIRDPYQYTLVTKLMDGEKVLDEYFTRFGVRTFAWDIDKGFFLNGRNVKLLGVCLHHDMGCIGTAVHRRALERELQILKDMGVNAIRTSHNPPAPELLTLADEMGFLVMDEAFDMWRKRKTEFDYARFFNEWHERDLTDFVKRDRNHPSIFMWSIGNEVPEQGSRPDDSLENLSPEEANYLLNFVDSNNTGDPKENDVNILLSRRLATIMRDLDSTRVISAGCNGVSPDNNLFVSGALDVYGFNYHSGFYDKTREWFPDKPLFGSETASAINSRGIYHQPSTKLEVLPGWFGFKETAPLPEDFQLTAYDMCRVPWGATAEEGWYAVRERDFIAGTFLWTGFDYLGEPTPFPWPARSSYFGVVDLAGFPKDSYWMYQSEWSEDKTVLHVLPHWNWNEGDIIDIWAYYNNADEVELFVNGKSFGKSAKEGERLHAQWLSVPFEPGKIEVVSYRDGQVVARDSRVTAGEPVSIRLTPDRNEISADGYDLSYITVDAIDADGNEVPTATDMLHFSIKGAGELFGVDNGNAADTLSLKGSDKALFSGKALAVVRSIKGKKGSAVLTVNAYGKEHSVEINTK